MFNFFRNKKVKRLNEMLDQKHGVPDELKDLIESVKNLAPHLPKKTFQNQLKEKLLLEHSKVKMKKTIIENDEVYVGRRLWTPWKMSLAALVLLLVVSTTSYPLIPAPVVEGYAQPGRTVEISYNAPVKVTFSQPMSKSSVEENFSIDPQIAGKFEWSGNDLLFYPSTPFEENQNYKVVIKNSAKSIFQKELQYDYMENFRIVGAPEAVLITPSDGSNEVLVSSKITFMFDRPMASLKPLEEVDLADLKIEVTPKVEGRVKFLGTSSFQFIPKKLDYSTEYSINISKGLESADGGHTEIDYSTKFRTEIPKVVSYQSPDAYFLSGNTNPENKIDYYSQHGQKPEWIIGFNQPMDIGKFKENTKLYVINNQALKDSLPTEVDSSSIPIATDEQLNVAGAESVPLSVEYHTFKDDSELSDEIKNERQIMINEGLEPDLSKNYLSIKPQNDLSLDSLYLLQTSSDLTGMEGNLTAAKESRFLIRTAAPFAMLSSLPDNDAKDSQETYIMLNFNNPTKQYEQEELKKLIKIDPIPEGKEITFSNYEYDPTHIYIYNVLEPSVSYTVTVDASLEDRFGQKLSQNSTIKFTTAQADPSFDIASNYSVSIMNAYKPIEYFARSTNVKNLNLSLKQLSEDEFFGLYGNGYLDLNKHPVVEPFETTSVQLEYQFNKKQFTRLDLEKTFGHRINPGVYYLEAVSDEVKDSYGVPHKQKIVFMVSEHALTYKHAKDHVLVWANQMNTGESASNVQISVRDGSGNVLAEGVTNSDGLFEAKITDPNTGNSYNHPDIYVIGKTDNDWSFVSNTWSDGVSYWNFNLNASYLPTPYYSVIYNDRPLYRPGDTVYFKGIIREAGNGDLNLPTLKSTNVTVSDSLGQTVFEKELEINGNGSFNGELALSEKASTGRYSIETTLSAPGGDTHQVTGSFEVNEYRKPDYKVTLNTDKENYVQGDKIKVDIGGEFFFGAAMPNSKVDWTVRSEDYYFNKYEGDAWYSFSEDGYFCYWGCGSSSDIVSQGTATLDANGHFVLDLDADLKEKKVSQFYTVEATVFDQNNQSVSNRIVVPVHQGDYYVGVANDDYVVKIGDDMKFKLIAVDYNGQPLNNADMEVELYEREWNTVKKKNVDGGYYYENEYEDTLVGTENATSDSQGKAEVTFKAEKGGLFRAIVKSKDKSGNEIMAAANAYVSSGSFVYWGFDNNDRLEIVPDKQEYKVGDTAKLLIKSPFEGVNALVTYEREDIEKQEVIKLDSNSTTLEIPITEDFLPNMFVSVAIFKGSNTTAGLPELEDSENEREVAAFKVGYVTLQVDTELKKMDIQLQLNKGSNERYLPGEEVTIDVETKDINGNSVPAEVSLSVVDESVLSLTENFVADLLNAFYRDRMLGVESAFSMTQALSRINVQIESGIKGGGGGYEGKRSTFKDTAFWKADIQTDSHGKGQVKFKVPDNLTSWEVLAIGVSKDTLVGSKKISFKTQKDVMIRSALPRFISVNDSFDAAVIINNNTNKEVKMLVSMQAENSDVSNAEQEVTIQANNQKKVVWPVNAPKTMSSNQVKFNILAKDKNGSELGDQLELVIPLKGTSFPEHVASAGSMTENLTKLESVVVPDYVDKGLSSLYVKVGPTFITSIQSALKDLVQYPYGCAEQTASVLWPNIKVKQMIGLPIIPSDAVDVKALDKNIETGVQTLYSYQQPSGGWGVWKDSEPSTYLTSYVLMTLNEAKKAGYAVDDEVLAQGMKYVTANINQNSLIDNKDDDLDANSRAFVVYVLAELNNPDTALANNLFDDHRTKLNIFAKAYLAMALQKGGVERKADILKTEILNLKNDTPRGINFSETKHYYSIFDTDTRSTAVVLQMLSRIDPKNPVNEKIIHYLLAERKGFGWNTTQEAATVIGALLEYVQTSGEANPNFEATVDVNKQNIITEFFTPDSTKAVEKTISGNDLILNNELAFSMKGVGKLYYDMVFEYFLPVEKIEARNEGIVIYQEYFDINDKKETKTINEIKAGDNVKAKMTVIVPDNRYYVSVEDFIPAGLEPIDFNLKTSQQSLREDLTESYNWWNNLWYFNHSEFRDDRVVFFADYLPKGVYEIQYYLRATSVGDFVDLPAKAQEMYVPEVFGQTTGGHFKVLETK